MASFPFFTAAAILVLSSVNGMRTVVFYHPVAGNCSTDLPAVRNYTAVKICSGDWYYQHVSFGHAGDRCASSQALQRGNRTYVDMRLFDPNANSYLNFQLDLTFHKNQGAVYTDALGAVGHMVSTDMKNYFYYVQCIQKNGQTQVVAMFTTRTPTVNAISQQAYQRFTAKLQQKNLLPPMYTVSHVNCPPQYLVASANDGLPMQF